MASFAGTATRLAMRTKGSSAGQWAWQPDLASAGPAWRCQRPRDPERRRPSSWTLAASRT